MCHLFANAQVKDTLIFDEKSKSSFLKIYPNISITEKGKIYWYKRVKNLTVYTVFFDYCDDCFDEGVSYIKILNSNNKLLWKRAMDLYCFGCLIDASNKHIVLSHSTDIYSASANEILVYDLKSGRLWKKISLKNISQLQLTFFIVKDDIIYAHFQSNEGGRFQVMEINIINDERKLLFSSEDNNNFSLKEDISNTHVFIVKNDVEVIKFLTQYPIEKGKVILFKKLNGETVHYDYKE